MSTLKVTNIQDTGGGNSSTSAEIYSGRAKAWVNFQGTSTVTIRSSFNVGSITDNGSGDYTINLTNALADGNYSCVGSCGNSNFGGLAFQTAQKAIGGTAIVTPTTTALRCTMSQANVGNQDAEHVHASFFR